MQDDGIEIADFKPPRHWKELSLVAHPVFNQVINFHKFILSINSFKDTIHIKHKNKYQQISLSALLLGLDSTLKLNQFMGYIEEKAIQMWEEFSESLRQGRIFCNFIVNENELIVLLRTCRNSINFSIEIANNFNIMCIENEKFYWYSILYEEQIKKLHNDNRYFNLQIISSILAQLYNFYSSIANL